jgi:hypothetical protein
MIRKLFFLLAVFCLIAAPVSAAVWPFAKKKGQQAAEEAVPKVFNSNKDENTPDKEWALDGIFTPKTASADLVVNGITFKGIKPEMLNSSYIPKTQDEIMQIAYAHKAWEGDAMIEMEKAAQDRILKAKKVSDEEYMKSLAMGEAQLAAVNKKFPKSTPSADPLQGQKIIVPPPAAQPAVQIYNSPDNENDPGTPSKVFKNYQ